MMVVYPCRLGTIESNNVVVRKVLPNKSADVVRVLWHIVGGLVSNGSIRLSLSDKGGEFVVMLQKLDRRITAAHLADTATYRPATETEFKVNAEG